MRNQVRLIACAVVGIAYAGLAGPSNDNFADAINLPGDTGTLSGNTAVAATFEADEPECLYQATTNTVWFKWTCLSDGTFTISTTGSQNNTDSSEWDAVVGVYTGATLATLTPVAGLSSGNPQDTGLDETVIFPVAAGTTYYFQMGGDSGDPPVDAANILLNWSWTPPPALAADAGPQPAVTASAPSAEIGGNPTARNGAAPYTYLWTPATGLSSATVPNPTASPASTTIYTVVVTDSVGAHATNSTTVTYMTPDSLISVDFVYDASGGPSIPYSGDTLLTGMLNNNTAGLLYAGQLGPWNALNVGGNNANNNSASLTAIVDGAGNPTTVSLALGHATTLGSSGGSWRNNYVDTINSAGDGGNLRQEEAYGYYPTLTSDHFNWELAGLTPNAHYRVTLFSLVGGSPSVSNMANTVAGVQDGEGDWNWSDIVATADGRITGSYSAVNDQTYGIYGLQMYKLDVALPLSASAGPAKTVSAATPSVAIGGSPTASGGKPPYSYSWTPVAGLSDALAANPTASPAATTTYTLIVTDSLGAHATNSVVVSYLTGNRSLISVDFVYNGLGGDNGGASIPCSGDTTLTGTGMRNAAGNMFTGQLGPWNPLVVGGNNTSQNTATSAPLLDGSGAVTGVQLLLGRATGLDNTAAGDWRTDFQPALTGGGGGNLRVETAYLYNAVLTSDHYAWVFTGLAPAESYKVTWFGDLGNAGGASNAANGIDGIRDSEGDWNWDSVTADAAGTILGTFTAPNPTLGLYGVQILKISSTPPTPTVSGMTTSGSGQFAIQGSLDVAGSVVVYKTTSLAAPINWVPDSTNHLPAGTFSIPVSNTTDPHAFYRLMGQ